MTATPSSAAIATTPPISQVRIFISRSPSLLTLLFDWTLNVSVDDYLKMESFDKSPWVLISKLTPGLAFDFQTFVQKLRKDLNEGIYNKHCGFSMFQATYSDLFLERERYSGIVPGIMNFHELLLWDDGNLWVADSWAGESKRRNRLAWNGAGWMSSSMRDYAKNSPDEIFPIPPGFDVELQQANEALLRSLDELTVFYSGQPKPIFNRERGNNYVRALCEFLPYRRSSGRLPWLPSNGLGDPGGPIRWQGLLANNLSMHKRHLLMDGWLSLWPGVNGNYYLQPASLALLFWAAREAGMPFTENPEAFIENYACHNDPLWFGGHWKPENKYA